MTALATEVHFSETAFIRVRYHKRGHLWRLVFALERAQQRVRRDEASTEYSAAVPPGELDDASQAELRKELNDPRDSETGSDAGDAYLKQARQIVIADQFSTRDPTYLIDALRSACGYKPVWNTKLDEADASRIDRVRTALHLAENERPYENSGSNDQVLFAQDLKDHAAGFLAPIIQRIEVGWPSRLLREGVTLVDLPGVGIAHDAYRRVTKSYIRDQARGVVLVVDRAGPTADTMELLRTSGYWDRVVAAADDPRSDPCTLLVAVTKVDDIASEEWRNTLPGPDGTKGRKREIYANLVEEFRIRMRRQAADQLGSIGSTNNETVSTARAAARDAILNGLEVHPVSATEFRKLILADEEDRAYELAAQASHECFGPRLDRGHDHARRDAPSVRLMGSHGQRGA